MTAQPHPNAASAPSRRPQAGRIPVGWRGAGGGPGEVAAPWGEGQPGTAVVPRPLPPPQGLGLLGTGHPPAPPPSPPLLIILFLNQGIRINTSLLMLW